MQYGESLADLVGALEGLSVDAILLMCSNPEAVSAGLPLLVDSFDGPVGAYPNLGYNPTGPLENRDTLTNQKPSGGPDIIQLGAYSPSRLAEFADEWKGDGCADYRRLLRVRALSTSWRWRPSSRAQADPRCP